ncbi:hypothetical protein S40293_03960 [Stachybotrys chartarum IBT 40293]|nr:hypothetical protein S40293_03960 [Stachybotrys chartarum IBT 40293]
MGTQGIPVLDRSEIRQHSSRKSCWIILNNTVYDVTEFLDSHPGGATLLLNHSGGDATEVFEGLHSPGTLERSLTPNQMVGCVAAVADDPKPKIDADAVQRRRVKLSSILSIGDFEKAAAQMLPVRSFAFFKSGAEDEYAYNWNLDSWKAIRLRPRVLRPVYVVDTGTSILGTRFSAPFFICPAGGGKLAHPSGEVLLTKAAARHDILHWVCNNAGCSKEETANARLHNQTLYWQIYAKSDLHESEREIKEALRLGYKAFALTVDAVRAGNRERDLRVGLEETLANGKAIEDEEETVDFANGQAVRRFWTTAVQWLRGLTDLPIAIKGIQCWEDAAQCLEYENVHPWLSNHGGRQIDASPSSMDTLVAIRKHCPDLCMKREVIVDGGVTRGADIVKALALGARGVGLGRAFLFSLALGEPGVSKAIRLLKDEIEMTMALLGVSSIDQLNPSHVSTSGLAKGIVYLPARL